MWLLFGMSGGGAMGSRIGGLPVFSVEPSAAPLYLFLWDAPPTSSLREFATLISPGARIFAKFAHPNLFFQIVFWERRLTDSLLLFKQIPRFCENLWFCVHRVLYCADFTFLRILYFESTSSRGVILGAFHRTLFPRLFDWNWATKSLPNSPFMLHRSSALLVLQWAVSCSHAAAGSLLDNGVIGWFLSLSI